MRCARHDATRPALFALLAIAAAILAAPVLADDETPDLRDRIKREAVVDAAELAAALALRDALSEDARRRADAAYGADAPTDRGLFVGPKRAWIVIAEHPDRADALAALRALTDQGVDATALALRDGGYEIALGPEPVGRARRALKSWRRAGLADLSARLSSGAQYAHRLAP